MSNDQEDIALMWYVATPDDLTATFETDHITGSHPSRSTYQLAYIDKDTNVNPTYLDIQNNTVTYSADYFFALTIDEHDQYDAKKYYYNEMKDTLSTTPVHLFDPEDLYRAETAYSGNLVVMQKFYKLPFALDLHFGYRNETFSKAEMNFDKTTESLKKAEDDFQNDFNTVFVQGQSNQPSESESVIEEKLRSLNSKHSHLNGNWTQDQLDTCQYALGNMLGSMTYMHGDSMVLRNGTVVKLDPKSLICIVPDRPDHPQGFMWDEGFHQHLISVWNINLTQQIITSWFNTIDQETGWICRQ